MKDKSQQRPLAPAGSKKTKPSSQLEGSFDHADAKTVCGWAWDTSQPNMPIKVEIYDGAALLTTILAEEFREDLKSAGKGDGKHAFNHALRQTLGDGQSHTISVRFAGTAKELPGSPKRFEQVAQERPVPITGTVRVALADQLFGLIDKSSVTRIVDIGCHRGAHIRDILRPNFPDAEIVGIEPKIDNFVECLKLKADKLNFFKLDCRALRRDNVGVFDFVFSFGLIYHLDDPTQLMKSVQSITHERSYVCIEGHIASETEQACLLSPNPPIISKVLDGEVYYGKMFKEFDETASSSEKERHHKASLDNPWSFWLTYESIVKMFINYGFCHIVDLRSRSLALGPGLIYAPVDPIREWSRRMFLISRSPINA